MQFVNSNFAKSFRNEYEFAQVTYALPLLKGLVRKIEKEQRFAFAVGEIEYLLQYTRKIHAIFTSLLDYWGYEAQGNDYLGTLGIIEKEQVLPELLNYQELALVVHVLLKSLIGIRLGSFEELRCSSINSAHRQIPMKSEIANLLSETLNVVVISVTLLSPKDWMIRCAPGMLSRLPSLCNDSSRSGYGVFTLLKVINIILRRTVDRASGSDSSKESIYYPFPKDSFESALSSLFLFTGESCTTIQDSWIRKIVPKGVVDTEVCCILARIYDFIWQCWESWSVTQKNMQVIQAHEIMHQLQEKRMHCSTNFSKDLSFRQNVLMSLCVCLFLHHQRKPSESPMKVLPTCIGGSLFRDILISEKERSYQSILNTLQTSQEHVKITPDIPEAMFITWTSLCFVECTFPSDGVRNECKMGCSPVLLINRIVLWLGCLDSSSSTFKTALAHQDSPIRELSIIFPPAILSTTLLESTLFFDAAACMSVCMQNLEDISLCYSTHIPSLDIIIRIAERWQADESADESIISSLREDIIEVTCQQLVHLWALDLHDDLFGVDEDVKYAEYSFEEKEHKLAVLSRVIRFTGLVASVPNQGGVEKGASQPILLLALPKVAEYARSKNNDIRLVAESALQMICNGTSPAIVLANNADYLFHSIEARLQFPMIYAATTENCIAFLRTLLDIGVSVDLATLKERKAYFPLISKQSIVKFFHELTVFPSGQALFTAFPQIEGLVHTLLFSVNQLLENSNKVRVISVLSEYLFILSSIQVKYSIENSSLPASINESLESFDIRNIRILQLRLWQFFLSNVMSDVFKVRKAVFHGLICCINSFFTCDAKLGDAPNDRLKTPSEQTETSLDIFIHTNALPSIHQTWTHAISLLLTYFPNKKIHNDANLTEVENMVLTNRIAMQTANPEVEIVDSSGKFLFMDDTVPPSTSNCISQENTLKTQMYITKIVALSKTRLRVPTKNVSSYLFSHNEQVEEALGLIFACCQAATNFMKERIQRDFYAIAESFCWLGATYASNGKSVDNVRHVIGMLESIVRTYDEDLWVKFSAADAAECLNQESHKVADFTLFERVGFLWLSIKLWENAISIS
ncbi:Hef3p [Perkinsela sp. CCAP 1560/4]|nr:Hef3p [Perkinsela sp. CCAP 1560/4]|eukprot:KNH09783.1 Hef3p [Perkinsela sp. CCAP 1560/4]